jgi:ferredoxin
METTRKIQKGAGIPIAEMADLKSKGVSLAQIGKMAGVSKQAVSQALKHHGLDPEEIKTFTKDRSLILRGKQKLVLSAITPEKVKTMSVRDAAVAAGILIDKQRLLDGESTANILCGFTRIDLTPYRGVLCAGCGICIAVCEVDGAGLCPTCREAKALPDHATEGGTNGA